MKCALIKLNAFIICEMLPPWIKALAIILRILSATLLSKVLVAGVSGSSIHCKQTGRGTHYGFYGWFSRVVQSQCSPFNVQCAVLGVWGVSCNIGVAAPS